MSRSLGLQALEVSSVYHCMKAPVDHINSLLCGEKAKPHHSVSARNDGLGIDLEDDKNRRSSPRSLDQAAKRGQVCRAITEVLPVGHTGINFLP